MKACVLLVLVSLLTSTVSPVAAYAAKRKKPDPLTTKQSQQKCPWFLTQVAKYQYALTPVGWVLGSADAVVLTVSAGQWSLLPASLSQILPMTNEIANVMSSATGQKWIYAGSGKQFADSVAMGALVGHSIAATSEHGMIVGALTAAANYGLTYWFPIKYFHTILHGIPKILPESVRTAAESKVGLGVLGISLIAIIEMVLHYTEELIEKVPGLFSEASLVENGRRTASVSEPIPLAHSLALFFIDHALFGDKAPADEKEKASQSKALLLVSGVRGHSLFNSAFSPGMKKELQRLPAEAFGHLDRVIALTGRKGLLRSLLSSTELKDLGERIRVISASQANH
ncbi:MAG: hypothetical protein H7301_08215 [Cryobacterium sp.]|nr:hypothetical protein [Oligoflexia bacterium]